MIGEGLLRLAALPANLRIALHTSILFADFVVGHVQRTLQQPALDAIVDGGECNPSEGDIAEQF
jgi:hypothetical protein